MFPGRVLSTDLLSFEHPSVLLFCFSVNIIIKTLNVLVTRNTNVRFEPFNTNRYQDITKVNLFENKIKENDA